MSRRLVLLIGTACIAVSACGSRAASPAPAPQTSATATADTVVLPGDSPMLQQLHRERVSLRDLPTDEIVAPGKVETNPNRVTKVVLPVAGRILSVLVKTGDAVRKDQPLLTIQSPDADAAMSA